MKRGLYPENKVIPFENIFKFFPEIRPHFIKSPKVKEKFLGFFSEIYQMKPEKDKLHKMTVGKQREKQVEQGFFDGMVIHAHEPMRVVEFSDGRYVVGEGKLIPVGSEDEGLELVKNDSLP